MKMNIHVITNIDDKPIYRIEKNVHCRHMHTNQFYMKVILYLGSTEYFNNIKKNFIKHFVFTYSLFHELKLSVSRILMIFAGQCEPNIKPRTYFIIFIDFVISI